MGRHALATTPDPSEFAPRCYTRDQAAKYLAISIPSLDRLIYSGALPVIRLPAQRDLFTQKGRRGSHRRVLIDVNDLNALIDRSKHHR